MASAQSAQHGSQAQRSVDYLLIGGGLASATAAREIRKRAPDASILIVGNESWQPYNRPPLSKEYLRGQINAEGIYGKGGVYVLKNDWYDTNHVELLHGQAVALDPATKTVRLADGQTFGYGKLLLATGGRPRVLDVPNADLPGIYYLRTLDDSDAIRRELEQHNRNVVVVGSGFIGLETAANSLFHHARVTIVEPQERPWPAMLPPALSAYLADQYSRRSATLRYSDSVSGFVAGEDGRVAGVQITPTGTNVVQEEETISCDLVIIGVGILLNSELAQQAGLEVDPHQGIVVNDRLQASAPDIYAAGDVADYPDSVLGRMHFEHWDNAIATGKAAAANMTGADQPYKHVPYFFSDQFDLSINMLGYPSNTAHVVVRGALADDQFTAFFIQDGRLRGAMQVNDDAQFNLVRDLIAEAVSVPNPTALLDPRFDLATLRPATETAADAPASDAQDAP